MPSLPDEKFIPAEVLRHAKREPPALLYHYTDQNGLLGIVTSGDIWASAIDNLNDTQEFQFGKQLALDVIERRRREASNEVGKHLEAMHDAASRAGINIFVASFSLVDDDLSQWRAYGGTGTGYSLGFAGPVLAELAEGQDFLLVECVYDERHQNQLMESIVDMTLAENIKPAPVARVEVAGGDMAYRLHRFAPMFKSNKFQGEREWRLISRPLSVNCDRVTFRPGRSNLAVHFHFPLQLGTMHTPLRLVTVGPCPDRDLSVKKAELLLVKYEGDGGRTKVQASEVPYRTW